MRLLNSTENDIFYGISGGGSADCGEIASQQYTDLPFYDNQPSVNVLFQALPPIPNQVSPFVVNIPETNTGMAVTIGLYSE